MVHFRLLFVAVSLFFLLFITNAKAQMSVYWADTLNKVLEQSLVDEKMNGLVGSVVFSDGSVWSSTAGKGGTQELSTDYVYDIGSNTKSMVSTILLLLEEESKLALSDTLYHFISPIKNVSHGITIEQLLQHRSGVADFTSHPEFYPEINANEFKFWHPDSILTTFVSEPDFAPGSSFEYSNTGYILLGKVIEQIENKPFNQVLRERIFNPLELDHVYLDQYDTYSQVKPGAWFGPSSYLNYNIPSFMSSAWSAGGVVSTPEDFARYTHKLFRGDLISEGSMVKMRQGTSLSNGSTYGLGIIEHSYRGKRYLGHGGTTLQNSEMEYSLESDFSLILVNIDNGYHNETRRVRNTFLELLEYIEANKVQSVPHKVSSPQLKVVAYPNPSSNQMSLKFENSDFSNSLSIIVTDLSGKTVFVQSAIGETVILQKSAIGTGLFFVRVMDGQEQVSTTRINFN